MSISSIIVCVLAAVVGLWGLVIIALTTDSVFAFHGAVMAAWSVLFIFFIVKRGFDIAQGKVNPYTDAA